MRGRGPAWILLSLSCVRADPNHCANQDGDASCREDGHGQFCSACADSNFGCGDEQPEDVCHVVGPSSASSSSSESGTSESGESSGPPPACTLEGTADPSCPETDPYCLDGACSRCDVAAPEFCLELDAATPACHAGWGRCVECTPDDGAACHGATAWCGNAFTCVGCFEHAHCPASACDLERGECMDDDRVMHVANAVCPDTGTGSEGAPYCSIASALGQIDAGERGTVILHGGAAAYDEALVVTDDPPRTIAVIGVDDPSIVTPADAWAAEVSAGQHLYVSGVRLSSESGSGVTCTGSDARVWLDDLTVSQNVQGLVVNLCKARLRRVRVIDNEGDGIAVSNSGEVRIESSIIANGGTADGVSTGLRVDDEASRIDVRYSTFANNVSKLSGPNIYCTAGAGGTIRNSIVLGPSLGTMNCPWAEVFSTVHDNADPLAGGDNHEVEVFDEAWWVGVGAADFHVTGAGAQVFGGRATWQLGDPLLDFDGDRRPAHPGVTNFAGADEP